MRITLRQLRAFRAVATTKNFTKAAEILSLTQSTLTKSVSELEDNLGVTLLERTTRSVKLTPAGGKFLLKANKVLNIIDDLIEGAENTKQEKRNVLKIAGESGIANLIFPKLIFYARENSFNFNITFLNGKSDEVIEEVRRGAADMAIVPLFGEPPDDLNAKKILSASLGVALPPFDCFINRNSFHANNLMSGDVFITNPPDSDISVKILHHNPECAQLMSNKVVAKNFDVQLSLAKAGLGGFFTSAILASHLRHENLMFLPFSTPKVFGNYFLVYKKEVGDSAVVEKLESCLKGVIHEMELHEDVHLF